MALQARLGPPIDDLLTHASTSHVYTGDSAIFHMTGVAKPTPSNYIVNGNGVQTDYFAAGAIAPGPHCQTGGFNLATKIARFGQNDFDAPWQN